MKLKRKPGGFTLIELLVVVSIIALLAVGAVPLYGKIMVDMKGKAALKQAYQIHQALYAYATGNDQSFPNEDPTGTAIEDANTAYRQLFVKDLIDNEGVFFVKGCAWHGRKSGPDGNRGTPADNFAEALAAGENHWGYVTGLTTDRDDTNTPLMMDGGIDGSPGVWSRDPKVPGGCWKGKFAITARTGGSVKVNDLVGADLVVKDKKDGQLVDIFSDAYGTKADNCRNPLSGGD